MAEEAAQETWIGVVRGLEHFEGRSSFKTWLFRILVKRARTTGVHEHRHLPIDDVERGVDPARFTDNGAWAEPPQPWEDDVDERVMAANWTKRLDHALHELPPRQRAWSSCTTWSSCAATRCASSSASARRTGGCFGTEGGAGFEPCSKTNSRARSNGDVAATP